MAWLKKHRISVLKYVAVTLFYYVSLCMSECPQSVREGKPHTLYCTWSHGQYNNIRNVSWRVTAHDQTTSTVSFCENITSDHKFPCTNTQNDSYIIARYMPTPSTQLTILNVSSELRNAKVDCVVNNNNADVVQSCNMSSVYSVPENVTCEAHRVGIYAIKVSCHAERVYPGMRCELLSASSSSTPMEYVNKFSGNDPKYYSVSCSTTVEIGAPGEYSYSVKITPSVDDVNESAIKHYPTNLVSIDMSPTNLVSIDTSPTNLVSIDMSPTNLVSIDMSPNVVLQNVSTLHMCPHTANVFTCDGFGLPSDTTFRWYIDREEINVTNNNITTHITGVSNGDPLNNTFESTFFWKPKLLHNRIQIKCKACFKKMDINQHCVEDIQQVEIIRPPMGPPYFMHNNESYPEALYELPVGGISNFQCVVNGGKPDVSSVSVTCDNPHQVFYSNQTHVSFTLKASAMLNRTCKCSAEHESKCYNDSAEVVFVIRSEPDVADVSSIIGYIALGFVVLLIFVILLAVVLYCCPCCEKILRRFLNYTLLKQTGSHHKHVIAENVNRGQQSRSRSSDDSNQQTSIKYVPGPQQEDNVPFNDLSGRDHQKSDENPYSDIDAKESSKTERKVLRSNTFSPQPSSPKMSSTFGNTNANRDIHSPGSCRYHLNSPDTYTIHSLLNQTLPSNPQPFLGPSEYVEPDSGPTRNTYMKFIAHEVPIENGFAETDHHVDRTNDDEHTFPKTVSDSSSCSPGNEYHKFSRLAGRRGTNNRSDNNNNKTNNKIHKLLPPSALATSRNSSVDQLSMVTFPGDLDPEQ